jgi:hypothetical protein
MPRAHPRGRQSNLNLGVGGAPPGLPQGTGTGTSRGRAKPATRLRNGGTVTSLPQPMGIQHFALSRKDGKMMTVDPQQFILGYVQWLTSVGACDQKDQVLAFNTGIQYCNTIGGGVI